MPRAGRDAAQVLDREAARVADPHLLVDPDLELADVLLEVTDHGGGLVADLTRAQGLGDPGHRLQLLTDAEPVGSRGGRDLAGTRNPGAGGLAGEEMIAAHSGAVHDLAQRALEAADEGGKSPGVDEIKIRVLLELADLCLESFELVEHARIISNKCTKHKP